MKTAQSRKTAAVTNEFLNADLGDVRLNRRLESIVKRLGAKPEVTFPRSMQTDADLEGFYRFLRNDNVTMEALLEPHAQATLARIRDHEEILAVHDTSEFRYGGDRGLGAIRKTGKGFLGHFTLAVTADEARVPLGVLGVETWTRLKPSPTALLKQGKISYAEARKMPREQERWWRGICRATEKVGTAASVIHVADSEADDYDLMADLVEGDERWVIRLCYDRSLTEELAGQKTREFVAKRTVVCKRKVHLSRRKRSPPGRAKTNRFEKRNERNATLAISGASIVFRRPNFSKRSPSLRVNVVSAREIAPPPGQKPVEWLLITTEPIETPAEILKVVDHYRARWVIEIAQTQSIKLRFASCFNGVFSSSSEGWASAA